MKKQKIDFTLMVNMSLEITKNTARVIVKNIKVKPATVTLPIAVRTKEKKATSKKKLGKPIHDIVLEAAKKLSKKADQGIFKAKDLYQLAIGNYPDLNKKSFNTYVISAAPEHTSWKHYRNGKDYLVYLGKGTYKLRESSQ
jgi:hypothetical protein